MNELTHYGIKGQKWGVRHDRKATGRWGHLAKDKKDKVTGEPFIGDSLIHSSMGGNMYVNGTTLILGDTSASLAHHGVKGQKWGVRRFQNRDGSLTANGRKRLGYAAKSAKSGITGAVKKTYAIGKHTAVRLKTGVGNVFSAGKKAAVASKNAVKKVNDYRIEKKKEKASQSRAGVMKNKKLFTNKELKELSDRFDIEDQITLNGVKKGAEVVQNVASSLTSIANAAKAGADAYKAFTGDTLIEGRGEKRDVKVAEAEKKQKEAESKRKEAESKQKEAETILKNKSKQMTDIIKKQKEITSQKVNAAENKAKAADERAKAVKSKEKDLSDREEALSKRERESVKFDRETNDRAKDLNARERQSNDRERELNERDRDVSAKNQRADDYLQRATAMMRAVDQRAEEVEAANAGRDIAAREISRALAESEARNVQLENKLNNEKKKRKK